MVIHILEAIILGVIQGLTEFIPVSSSGHLLIFGSLFDVDQSSFAFDLALHVGTLAALIVYFWHDLIQIGEKLIRGRDNSLLVLLVVSTIPAVLVGAFALPYVEEYFRSPVLPVVMLVLIGLVMIFTDKLKSDKQFTQITVKDALIIGCAQVIAFIPGVSRSGITIIAGRGLNFSHEVAARFSFLIAIPVTFGAVLRLLFAPSFSGMIADDPYGITAGIIASFISGLIAIKFMLKFLRTHGLKWFGVYRIIFAGVVLFLLFNRGLI